MLSFFSLRKYCSPRPVIRRGSAWLPGLLFALCLLSACAAKKQAGIRKDFQTGLTCSWETTEPADVFLAMNDQRLTHTDIPLGEQFMVINQGMKGLILKNGKVAVGCSLKITDSDGRVLLQEADLYEGHDRFTEKEAALLRCIINTGAPMEAGSQYAVEVVFRDKNGQGKSVNRITIRCTGG